MKIIYSVGAPVPGGGIGNLASHALEAINSSAYLKRALLQENKTQLPKELVKEVKINRLIRNYYWKDLAFDLLASRWVDDCDLFHGWNNMSLYSLRKAKNLRATVVIERASSHILTQNQLLKEEYSLFNVNYQPIDERTIKRSIQEYKEADYIFIPSEFVKKSFIEQGVEEKKLKMIEFGVDLEKFRPPREKNLEKFRIIFVGQVGLRKGVQYLLKAWEELNLKEAELLIVGPVFPDFEKLYKKYKNLPNTTFLNYSFETEKLYQDSSIFVFPTIEEGTALAVLDALASGLPVITTPNSGSPIENQEEGFLVSIRDVDELKKRILDLYEDKRLLVKMGEKARKKMENLSWGKYRENLIKTYEEVNK